MSKKEILIENVSKTLDNHLILDNINIHLKPNHIYGLVGRNGSGKTMLLKTICGLIKPDTGKVLVCGEDIYAKHTFPKNTLALIERPEFIPDITGFENLQILAEINQKIGGKEINETLDLVNLQDEKFKKYKKYSLGMKQKLGIAQVLMENPDILIFDEPFNGVDEPSIKKISEYLKEYKNKDKIIIISTHIREDVDNLCDEIYHIHDGRLEDYHEKCNPNESY